MYHEERRKLLGLLLINSGVSYIQRIKKIKKGGGGDLAG